MSFIEVKNVTKKFDNEPVLKNINIDIYEGEVLGVLGRSGSGKSVLLNMLRGIPEYEPDEGEVIYHVSECSKCHRVDVPSKVNSPCSCGGKLEEKEINLWKSSRSDFPAVKRRISIMLQRTFALYEEKTVI